MRNTLLTIGVIVVLGSTANLMRCTYRLGCMTNQPTTTKTSMAKQDMDKPVDTVAHLEAELIAAAINRKITEWQSRKRN